jgi:hypothetical protein
MADSKSIPTAPVLHPPGDALPDLQVLTAAAIAQSKTAAECAAVLESSLAPYVDLPGAETLRFAHGMLGMIRALAANPHGLH